MFFYILRDMLLGGKGERHNNVVLRSVCTSKLSRSIRLLRTIYCHPSCCSGPVMDLAQSMDWSYFSIVL